MTPTFVNISGGRTSGFMAYLLKDKPDHYFLFQNTGREAPETYEFVNELDERFNLNLVWLEYHCPDPKEKATFKVVCKNSYSKNTPFEQLMVKRHNAVPNRAKRFCTVELKTKTARRYIRSLGCKNWFYALGYRADEDRKTHDNIKAQTTITPLKDFGVTAKHVAQFWKEQDFDLKLPMLPNGKTFGGNCMGCFWHSEYQHAHLCVNRPEEYDWLIQQEEKYGYTFNDNYSYKDLKELVENKQWDLLSQTDELCQEVNGSCGL